MASRYQAGKARSATAEGPGIRPRRLPGPERRRYITQVAAALFAEHGFAVSTRQISEAAGITQAALYKHFRSKAALLEAVFRQCYLDQRASEFHTRLQCGDVPLAERLSTAYCAFYAEIDDVSLKLFQRAAHDGLQLVERYSPHLDSRILLPVLDALRADAGLPDLSAISYTTEERELVLMLHSSIVFLAIRKFIYRVDLGGREAAIIRQHVDTWLHGARATLRELNTALAALPADCT